MNANVIIKYIFVSVCKKIVGYTAFEPFGYAEICLRAGHSMHFKKTRLHQTVSNCTRGGFALSCSDSAAHTS